jgi:hypothetical protein
MVLVRKPSSGTSLQVDCWLSQNDGTTNSELGYPTMYHHIGHPMPNPSVRIPRNYVTLVECVSSSLKLQLKGQTSVVSEYAPMSAAKQQNTHHFGTGHDHNRISQPK